VALALVTFDEIPAVSSADTWMIHLFELDAAQMSRYFESCLTLNEIGERVWSNPMCETPEHVGIKLCLPAVAAFGLAWSFLLVFPVPFVFPVAWRGDLGAFLVMMVLVLEVSAMVLGIISLVIIEKGGGRLVGRRYAKCGIILPIVLFVVGIVMPMLARNRVIPNRITCGSKLSSLGKAMLIYSNDYEDRLPKAGGKNSQWASSIPNWRATKRSDAYGMSGPEGQGTTSIGSSLYLLIKYTDVKPNQFVCPQSEHPASEFALSQYDGLAEDVELFDVWDFGPNPIRHYDYTYHAPFDGPALTMSADPATAVAADLNPWIPDRAHRRRDFTAFLPDTSPWQGSLEQARSGNSSVHQADGQNVLFLDAHVGFEKRPYCGKDDDNVYTMQKGEERVRGTAPVPYDCRPANKQDSLLLHDPPTSQE